MRMRSIRTIEVERAALKAVNVSYVEVGGALSWQWGYRAAFPSSAGAAGGRGIKRPACTLTSINVSISPPYATMT